MPCASAAAGPCPRTSAHSEPATRQSPAPLVFTTRAGSAGKWVTRSRPSQLHTISSPADGSFILVAESSRHTDVSGCRTPAMLKPEESEPLT